MVIPESCPACGSTRYKKNGHTRHGKQNHLCKTCEPQFSASAANHLISAERRAEIANLLRERLSLRGICRAMGVSLTWLLHFMVECFATCPDHLHMRLPASPANVLIYKLEAEADEMWSFVQKKENKQWIWLAMDATTRQIIAFHVGDRSRESAKALWATIAANQPSNWRQETHAADLVIIAHGSFLASTAPLQALREAQGWTVALVDVEDLYDEFAFGAKTPEALRDFLAWTQAHWQQPPSHVLLVGDASYDPRPAQRIWRVVLDGLDAVFHRSWR